MWSELLHVNMEEVGFTRYGTDSCLHFRRQDGDITLFDVYVDDLLFTASSQKLVKLFFETINCLSKKDLGEARKFLGMRVNVGDLNTYTLDQQASIEEMLQYHGLSESNGVRASIGEDANEVEKDPGYLTTWAGRADEPTIHDFQSLVGSLLWVARCTHPDISFAVHKATRRTHQPTMSDWKLAKKIR